jgi:hypothetical protein
MCDSYKKNIIFLEIIHFSMHIPALINRKDFFSHYVILVKEHT